MATSADQLPPSLRYAQAVLAQLIAQGVREIVVCPGSRSAPFAYAAVQAERAGLVRLHVRIDERTAGFFALGIGKASGVPAAVVTTSGTAVANLHPAVLEADHSHIPLIVVSADRPHELRGTGANQTTTHVGMFGPSPRLAVDSGVPAGLQTELIDARAIAARAVAAATGVAGYPGPVHLNIGFREPLAPDAQQLAELGRLFTTLGEPVFLGKRHRVDTAPIKVSAGREGLPQPLDASLPTVVIAGDGALVQAAKIAQIHGWPLISEPSSGVHTETNALPGAVNILAQSHDAPEGSWASRAAHLVRSIRQVLVFGHPTLTRPVQRLIAREDTLVAVFPSDSGQWTDASRTADAVFYDVPSELLQVDPEESSDSAAAHTDARGTWLRQWQELHAELDVTLTQELSGIDTLTGPTTPMQAVRTVVDHTKPGETLVFGASSAIRDADLYVTTWPQGVRVLSHRGLAGIDGTVSMALGVASALSGRTRLVVGDLTFLHDAGALLHGPHEPAVDLDIIVLNDNGGAIFGGLEHAAAGDVELYQRVFGTPHVSDLAALCSGYAVEHSLVEDVKGLDAFLSQGPRGIRVAELRFSRNERSDTHTQLLSSLRVARER